MPNSSGLRGIPVPRFPPSLRATARTNGFGLKMSKHSRSSGNRGGQYSPPPLEGPSARSCRLTCLMMYSIDFGRESKRLPSSIIVGMSHGSPADRESSPSREQGTNTWAVGEPPNVSCRHAPAWVMRSCGIDRPRLRRARAAPSPLDFGAFTKPTSSKSLSMELAFCQNEDAQPQTGIIRHLLIAPSRISFKSLRIAISADPVFQQSEPNSFTTKTSP